MPATLIESARVFDGEEVLGITSLRIVGDRIDQVGPALRADAGDVVHDGHGTTVFPGLIDCHVHSTPATPAHALLFGVTTELDMNSLPEWMNGLRAAARQSSAVADIRSSSTGLTVNGGHPTQLIPAEHVPHFPVVESVDDVEAFIDARVAEGADYIKVYVEDGQLLGGRHLPSVDRPIIERAVEIGHDRGKIVVAHALKQHYAKLAVEAGVDGLVHLFVDTPITDSLIATMRTQSTFVVPTLTTLGSVTATRTLDRLADDPRVSPFLTEEWAANLRSTWPPNNSETRLETAMWSLAQLHAAGVEILAGSDAARAGSAPGSAHGLSIHDELRLLVECALTPVEALRAATSGPARVFGLADRGLLRPGMRADLVMVHGDPTDLIDQSLSIRSVWRGGVPLDRGAQARRLQQGERG